MLLTKIINKNTCAVAWNPTEIMVRNRGRDYYGTEETLVRITDGVLIINFEVANAFEIPIKSTAGIVVEEPDRRNPFRPF